MSSSTLELGLWGQSSTGVKPSSTEPCLPPSVKIVRLVMLHHNLIDSCIIFCLLCHQILIKTMEKRISNNNIIAIITPFEVLLKVQLNSDFLEWDPELPTTLVLGMSKNLD